jgi:hypothetical protein
MKLPFEEHSSIAFYTSSKPKMKSVEGIEQVNGSKKGKIELVMGSWREFW